VEFFFIDTNPFVESYWVENNKDYIWQLPISRQDYIAHELMNLTDALETSKAKWKIVVGHHTMRSVGKHGETHELLTEVLPILEANGVDMYINGHDHCLQHIKRSDSSLHFLTSGGGSKAWRGRGTNKDKDTGLQFYYDGQGFAAVSMAPSLFHMDFYDISGNILHSLDLSKD
jgi:tartrate-resistant acid phosphatase type 5